MQIQRNNGCLKVERNKALFIQLNSESAKQLRRKLYEKTKGICPILQIKIAFDKMVLDHKHKRKTDPIGPNGDGLVRGVLDFRANSLEGIYLKKFKKSGLLGVIDFTIFLRRLADYLDNPGCPQYYIYPSEKPPVEKLKKRDFDLICKWYAAKYPKRKKLPTYPKSGIKIKRVSHPSNPGKELVKRTYKAKLSPKWAKMLKQAKEWKNGK